MRTFAGPYQDTHQLQMIFSAISDDRARIAWINDDCSASVSD
jgi:hypothetical protein